MKKILAICGPTGVGKTQVALMLAKKFNGELISADSRQIYKGLDVATGKDIETAIKKPLPWKEKSTNYYWELEGIPIYLLDVANIEDDFSAAKYKVLGARALEYVYSKNKLPIIVGGTGFYLKALLEKIPTLGIPPNQKLRSAYSNKSPGELLLLLSHLNPELAESLNPSERANKQRLIRRIEILQSGQTVTKESTAQPYDILYIGVTTSEENLRKKINARIDSWIDNMEKETEKIARNKVSWSYQSMNALGYKQWREYLEGRQTKEEAIKRWKIAEWHYAKRQITWFKKQKNINWVDVDDSRCEEKIEKLVRSWYNQTNGTNNRNLS